jgi:hypothetical protein
MAKKQRAVVVYGSGEVYLANGKKDVPYDLDKTIQEGGKILDTKVIGLKCAPGIGPHGGRRYGTASATA